MVGFDPNLRLGMWHNIEEAKEMMRNSLRKAHMAELSLNEFKMISDSEKIERANELRTEYGIELLMVTLGAKGAYYCNASNQGFVEGYKVEVVDTTGAGDGFFGGVLYKIIQLKTFDPASLSNLTKEQLVEITEFANTAGALTTTKLGVAPALPTIEEINTLFKKESLR